MFLITAADMRVHLLISCSAGNQSASCVCKCVCVSVDGLGGSIWGCGGDRSGRGGGTETETKRRGAFTLKVRRGSKLARALLSTPRSFFSFCEFFHGDAAAPRGCHGDDGRQDGRRAGGER